MKIVLLVVGLALTMLGTVLMMYQDITITTQSQKVLEVGPLQAATEQGRTVIPISPIVGIVVVALGALAVFAGAYMPRRQAKPAPGRVTAARAPLMP